MTNQHASELGRLGGKARAKVLDEKRRSEIARKASLARWKGHNKKRPPAPVE